MLGPALEGFAPTPEFPEIGDAQALLAAVEADARLWLGHWSTGRFPTIAAVEARYREEICGVANVRAAVGRCQGEGATVQFRVQFLDASGTIIQEMHAAAWNAAAAIALVKGMEWPARAVRMVILDELGGEVHSESK
jgi:hypothetical protein